MAPRLRGERRDFREIVEHGGRNPQHLGLVFLDGTKDILVRELASEEPNVPARRLQDIRHHVPADLVELALHPGDHRPSPPLRGN
jgi:hypothetical protein